MDFWYIFSNHYATNPFSAIWNECDEYNYTVDWTSSYTLSILRKFVIFGRHLIFDTVSWTCDFESFSIIYSKFIQASKALSQSFAMQIMVEAGPHTGQPSHTLCLPRIPLFFFPSPVLVSKLRFLCRIACCRPADQTRIVIRFKSATLGFSMSE